MKILIIDTETIALEKRFIYDLGWIVYDTVNDKILEKRQYIVDQIWYNKALFETRYFNHNGQNNKMDKYKALTRGRKPKAKIKKYGHIMMILEGDINRHNVSHWGAYNKSFDKGAFDYNNKWYNTKDRLSHLPQFDIQGMAKIIHEREDYKNYCSVNGHYGDSGYIKTNAEITYRFITQNHDFIEEHTSLQDCEIELEILKHALQNGAKWNDKSTFVVGNATQELKVIHQETTYTFKYNSRKNTKKGIVLK